MVKVGERSGELERMLERVAERLGPGVGPADWAIDLIRPRIVISLIDALRGKRFRRITLKSG